MSVHPDPFAPARLGPIALRNRIIKAATFEGLTGKQQVDDRLIAFHRAMARGGVGMTTLAFCAVSRDGAATPNELVLRDEAVPGLRRLADAVHSEGAAISAQIGGREIVIGKMRQDIEINTVFGERLRVLAEAKFFEPLRDVVGRDLFCHSDGSALFTVSGEVYGAPARESMNARKSPVRPDCEESTSSAKAGHWWQNSHDSLKSKYGWRMVCPPSI